MHSGQSLYLSMRTPTPEGKSTYTSHDFPTGHSIPCDILSVEKIPYPADFASTRSIRDTNIEKWFTIWH